MSTLMMPTAAASALNIPATTVNRHPDLVEAVLVVRRIPAWSTNLTQRAVATPTLICPGSRLAGRPAGVTAKRALQPTTPVAPLLENFVLGELARQITWTEATIRPLHHRDLSPSCLAGRWMPRHSGSSQVVASHLLRGPDLDRDDLAGGCSRMASTS
jgi:hypothetical protein